MGNRIAFDGVFGSGGDLVYEVGGKEVKERIVLASAPEAGRPVEFRFPMVLEGVRAQIAGDGGVTLSAPSGEVVYRIPPGYAWDSRHRGVGGPEVGVGASVSPVAFGLEDGRRRVSRLRCLLGFGRVLRRRCLGSFVLGSWGRLGMLRVRILRRRIRVGFGRRPLLRLGLPKV